MYHAESIRRESRFALPFGEARYAPITAEDQGAVIASIFKDPEPHAGKTYSLCGPFELDQFEIAQLLTEVLGRKITYVPVELEAYKQGMAKKGFTAHFIQYVESVAQDCRDGVFSGLNDNVENITGQKPKTMKYYIFTNKGFFA